MKLEDCKPGTRVRVYAQYNFESFKGEIERVIDDGTNRVALKGHALFFHPQQLRKLVKRKKSPEIMCVFTKDGKWQGTFFDKTPELIEARKQNGREVWIMRGVKKL